MDSISQDQYKGMVEDQISAIVNGFSDFYVETLQEPHLPMLRGLENFRLWRKKFESLLFTRHLLDHTASVGESGSSKYQRPKSLLSDSMELTWRRHDALICKVIKSTVPREIAPTLYGDAKDMYHAVCALFKLRPLKAFTRLGNIRWDGEEDRIKFTQRWSNAAREWVGQMDRDVLEPVVCLLYMTSIQAAYGYGAWTFVDDARDELSMVNRPLYDIIRQFCLGKLL